MAEVYSSLLSNRLPEVDGESSRIE
jgi:hypothetical protein